MDYYSVVLIMRYEKQNNHAKKQTSRNATSF
jgi:hypothetical protein